MHSSKGHLVPSGPRNLHFALLREQQAAEQPRKKAAKERQEAEVAKARQVRAVKKFQAKMTSEEKEARKQARRLLRAVDKHNNRPVLGGSGSPNVDGESAGAPM